MIPANPWVHCCIPPPSWRDLKNAITVQTGLWESQPCTVSRSLVLWYGQPPYCYFIHPKSVLPFVLCLQLSLTCQADRSDRHHGHFRALSTILCHAALSLHHHNTPLHKCTLVQTLRFCTGRTAHRGSRGIALLFHDHSTRRGWGVSVTPRPLFTPGKDPVPIVQEAGWAPGQVWTGAENLAHSGIRYPDRPVRSQSLYRLSYRAHSCVV